MRTPGFASWTILCGAGLGLVVGCGSGTGSLSNGSGASSAGGGVVGGAGQGGDGGGNCTPSPELCNGFDDDCDGQVDEECPCVQGEEKACYSGEPATNGVGACKSGTQKCTDTGTFGSCDGEVTPSEEVCNKLDDDCNGEADDGLGEETCGVGACQVTVQTCVDGEAQTCMPGHPEAEKCDGLDNDCNGTVDDGCDCIDGQKQACYTGAPATKNVGECKDGEQVCADGKWGACTGDTLPATETCDGKDQNCDGQVDDGNPGSGQGCDTGKTGVCKAGLTDCQNGALQCVQTLQPSNEKCDGLDNDCNGNVDEGNPDGGGMCNTGSPGICAAGTQQCQNGSLKCAPDNLPGTEQCNNLDDDCDGAVDEGNPGGGNMCNTGKAGVCAAGTQMCMGGALACVQDKQPNAESCNGLDDDCDGQSDEGNPGGGGNCSTGLAGICSAGTQMCVGGSLQCQQNQQPKTEQCNGQDDDCDGQTDENNPGGGGNCSTGLPGICSPGTQVCQNGSLQCQQSQQPKAESCNNLDDDCDGATDEGNPGGGGNCSTGLPGICSAGTMTCTNGSLSCKQNQQAKTEQCGNNLDDDCDGQVDEGCGNCITNLAKTATGSHSGGGAGGYGPGAWNDGAIESSCAFGWVSNSTAADGKWVQYNWSGTQTIGSMYVDANACSGSPCGTGRTMYGGTVQWWNGSTWITAQSFSGNDGDRAFNFNPPLVTDRIRIYNIRAATCQQDSNTKIYEWYVWSGNNCTP